MKPAGPAPAHAPQFTTAAPAPLLRDFVSHYWLSLNNAEPSFAALPDGAVDLVIQSEASGAQSWVYGTLTHRADIALAPRNHYLGVRFKPGQSRHFLRASAHELTNLRAPAAHLLGFPLARIENNIPGASAFGQLDQVLIGHLARQTPKRSRIDAAIALIEASGGNADTEAAAAAFGRSRRQFERVFLQTVGVSAKFFALTTRFRNAAARIVHAPASLADVAAVSGYADQSHMSHDFKRLAHLSPRQLTRKNVAFLQGLQLPYQHNQHS